jgi:hypothetical protein
VGRKAIYSPEEKLQIVLYVQKWAIHRLEDPETITVTLEPS